MKIIDFEYKHITEVVNIEFSSFSYDVWDREEFSSQIEEDTNYCRVVIIENRVVAFMIVSFVTENVELLNIATHKNFRKKGIAKLLMYDLLSFSKKIYAEKILLEVKRENIPAINFYKKYNFIKISERNNYYSDGSDADIMMLKL